MSNGKQWQKKKAISTVICATFPPETNYDFCHSLLFKEAFVEFVGGMIAV